MGLLRVFGACWGGLGLLGVALGPLWLLEANKDLLLSVLEARHDSELRHHYGGRWKNVLARKLLRAIGARPLDRNVEYRERFLTILLK